MSMPVHAKIKAKNSGDIVGESSQTSLGREDTIECNSFEFSMQSGSEGFAARSSGTRNYSPISIEKRIDKATPFLAQAFARNEEIEGEFMFFRPAPVGDGTTEHFFTVRIKKARISSISISSPDASFGGVSSDPPTEVVEFNFNNIVAVYEPTGGEFEDDFETHE